MTSGHQSNQVMLKTNLGAIILELDQEHAPATSANFLRYVNAGFYNNTLFHRVIPGFMIQGGGFESGMLQKKTQEPIRNEASQALKNCRGTVAMARTSDPHSATAQFFINLTDNHFLDYTAASRDGWGYCVFGKVVEGMHIVEKIAAVNTTTKSGHQNVPIADVIIEEATTYDSHPS